MNSSGMERRTPFALVDVFTDDPLSGNPLAVVPDAQAVDERLYPTIARELNQSETTFLMPSERGAGAWRLRSFTPAGVEVFGPGHNALGAWWWLAVAGRLRLDGARTTLQQELGPRLFSVTVEADRDGVSAIEMEQGVPELRAEVRDDGALARALGLSAADLLTEELPARVVSVGAPHLLVAVRRDALGAVRPDSELLRSLLLAAGAEGCYVYSVNPGEASDAAARFFNPVAGIVEDPATGSAAGPLAAYLLRRGRLAGPHVRIAQGAATGRPSTIDVVVRDGRVTLCGRAVVVAEGTLLLPRLA